MPDERALALCELSGDLVYHKIPQEKLAYYVDEALRLGREAAAAYKGQDMVALYKAEGIGIVYLDDGKAAFGMVYRGQAVLDKKGCSVELFRSSIRELSAHSGGDGMEPIDYEKALQVHLAHEFFHFLEFRKGQTVAQSLPAITSMQVLGLKRHSHINRLSEIAAHAFAKEVTGLPVLPNHYDYMYLIGTGNMKREAYDAKLQEMQALL